MASTYTTTTPTTATATTTSINNDISKFAIVNNNDNNKVLYYKRYLKYYDVFTIGIISTLTLPLYTSDISTLSHILSTQHSNALENHSKSNFVTIHTFYETHRLSITYVTHVFLLLTFGIGYPPLAVILFISITLQTLVLQLGIHYHYLQSEKHPVLYKAWNKVLEIEIQNFGTYLSETLYLSIVLSSLFVTAFIMDMSWEQNTSSGYFILPVIFIFMTGLILLLVPYIYKVDNPYLRSLSSSLSSIFIELTNIRNRIVVWPVRPNNNIKDDVLNPVYFVREKD